jgi:hypothetical protein
MENYVQMHSLFEVITAILKKIQVLWEMTPYTSVNIYRCYTRTYFLYFQDGLRRAWTYPKLEAAKFFKTSVNF